MNNSFLRFARSSPHPNWRHFLWGVALGSLPLLLVLLVVVVVATTPTCVERGVYGNCILHAQLLPQLVIALLLVVSAVLFLVALAVMVLCLCRKKLRYLGLGLFAMELLSAVVAAAGAEMFQALLFRSVDI